MFYNSAYGALPVSFDSAVTVLIFEYKLADFDIDNYLQGVLWLLQRCATVH